MAVVERICLVVNRRSGAGHGREVADGLRSILLGFSGGGLEVRVEVVEDHIAARDRAARFVRQSEAPALVVAGGGNGTLRAVIEGLCGGGGLPAGERARVGVLRMGSGNPLARRLGAPRDPEAGLRGILANLREGRTVRCCVMRCEVGTSGGRSEVYYATTMCGLGQFGRVPGDLDRWHRRLGPVSRAAGRLFGIERVTDVEYVGALLARSARCAVLGRSACEVVEVSSDGGTETFPLLAGVALNFSLEQLPVDPGTRVEEEAVSLYLLPFTGRWSALRMILAPRRAFREALRVRIEGSRRVEIRAAKRGAVEFFLDEDPMTFHGRLAIEVAGSLAFVPGPEYEEVSS